MGVSRPWSEDLQTDHALAWPYRRYPWAWIAGYTLAAYLLSLHELVPVVPGTTFSLISLPAALLAFALMVRPWTEAPVYILIHAASWLVFHSGLEFHGYQAARITLEIVEVVVVILLTRRYYPQLNDPLFVAVYHVTVLGITAVGGLLVVAAAFVAPSFGIEPPPVLIERPALAWRYWWLGHACSFLALGGPLAVLFALRRRLLQTLFGDPPARRTFLWLLGALVVACLIAFPVADLSRLGLPADVRQALRLLPLPFALALSVRFRAKGASTAIIILALVVILSLTGPNAEANWVGLPPSATPTQAQLLLTATAGFVIAAISRQLLKAQTDAIRAREAKSRFVSMLNHELRTPLNAILGFSELMRLQKVRDIDEAMGGIENIHASGQRLLAMIEGLLSQADHGASAFELHKHQLPLRDFVAKVVEELQPGSLVFRYPVNIDIPKDLLIEADRRALEQILLVLLSYPLRFVTPQTVISVTAHQSGTDTVLDVHSLGLSSAVADERDKLELQLAKALALAHGARLTIVHSDRSSRHARLTFFATRAAL